VTFFDDEIERVDLIHPVTGKAVERIREASIFPAQHYVTQTDSIERSKPLIEAEMEDMVERFTQEGKLLEAQRIRMRTRYDLEMLTEVGYCSGIENYSRYLDGREAGDPPGTLVDFFPEDFLTIVDESHITLPQVRGMFNGDRARKTVLVDNGFRLPSCLDNRPLEWREFENKMRTAVFVSATPGDYEVENSARLVEQVIRPTGVVDPEVEILPATGQVDDLIERLRAVTEKKERALVLTLTKKSSEDLAEYLREMQFKVKYIHSELNTFERAELIRDLRRGDIQVLVGINLLREGMDLPEVSLVAILDADREGYLRSYRSLIQIMGRAARNINSKVYLYADKETESIRKSVEETRRRRQKQLDFNELHGIVPRNIEKEVTNLLPQELLEAYSLDPLVSDADDKTKPALSLQDLERAMWEAVEKLDFERAAALRDLIAEGKTDWKPTVVKKRARRH
jgi:excinuclease ABC subunit B